MHIPQAVLIPMTTSDVNKAKELLKRPYICAQPHWKEEVKKYPYNASLPSLVSGRLFSYIHQISFDL